MKTRITLFALLVASASAASAQDKPDYTTVEGIMTELYASVTRQKGEPFPWERLRAIVLPETIMMPQPRQTGGKSTLMDVDSFVTWIDTGWKPIIGTDRDNGFFEKQINLVVDQYGDVAHAFSTYEKGPYEPRRIMGRGINAVQLVRREGRWYILSITWDEENTAGALPPKYGGK